jgi:hypothetical protein
MDVLAEPEDDLEVVIEGDAPWGSAAPDLEGDAEATVSGKAPWE